MSEIKIADMTVKPGSKSSGFVKVAETSTFEIELPIHIINGVSKGPTYAIIAGIHPVEYPPMEGSIRLAKEIDPKKLKGTLITIPVFNTPGFQARVPGAPLERTPLTSAFPGNPEGGMNERIAHFITNEIIKISDFVMEAHGCNFQETCPNHVIMQRTGNKELDKKTLDYARCFDGNYVRRAMDHHISEMREKGYSVMTQALKMNKPCILPEVGSAGGISSKTGQINEQDVKWFMDGVKNFMRHIRMLEGEAKFYDPYAVKEVYHFRSKSAGWFYPLKENDGKVAKGEVIGEVRDFFGNVKEQITAPADGIISLIWTRPAVDQGSILLQMFELGPKTSTIF